MADEKAVYEIMTETAVGTEMAGAWEVIFAETEAFLLVHFGIIWNLVILSVGNRWYAIWMG